MKRGLLVGMGLVLVGGVVTPAVAPVGLDSASAGITRAAMPYDFDGDGYADLAVGVPGEELRGKREAGAVQVLYGSASGATARDQLWHQARKGVKGAPKRYDRFGQALASGDFDADGFADLAIGVPTQRPAGAVQVLYGGPRGLTARDQVWHQGKPGVPGANEGGDYFGGNLGAGDFDGDGYGDLVIGIPGEAVGSSGADAGAIVVLRGSGSGLTSAGATKLEQGSGGLASQPRAHEGFGREFAVGDVNGDGRDDLVIRVATERDMLAPGQEEDPGSAVHLVIGGPSGLTAAGSQFFGLGALGLDPRGQISGLTLADTDADGRADLSLVIRQYWIPDVSVAVLHGHQDGFHPVALAAPGQPGVDAILHLAVTPGHEVSAASGDLTGNGRVELAVYYDQSIVVVAGIDAVQAWTITPWPVLIEGQYLAPGGWTELNVLPLSGTAPDWLVVGAQSGSVTSTPLFSGTVNVLQGTPSGTPEPVAVWHQDSPGVKGTAEPGDRFGAVAP